jgi:Holliday junction resolvasome RuvABC endonuclease subunit
VSLILGLDPAQNCGFALFDTAADLSAIRAGVLKAKGDDYEHKAASLGFVLMKLIKAERPDFIVIEMPLRAQPRPPHKKMKFMGEDAEEEVKAGSGLNAVISSNQMAGALSGIIGAYGIPFELIKDSVWRKQFLGFGTRPGWQRKDWKKAVRDRCAQLKIVVTNDDQADAVGIAFAGASCQSLKMMQQARAA